MHRFIIRALCTHIQRRVNIQNIPAALYCTQSVKTVKWNPKSPTEMKTNFADEDPDTFGTLSEETDINTILDSMPNEEGDEISFDIVDETGRNKSRNPEYYAKLIKKLLEQKRVVDAIDILDVKMKEDRARPNYYIYNLLITGCARVGYSKKAFQLYNQMKKRGIKVTPGTYTALFNACANSPYPKDGIERANHLREIIMKKSYEPNLINYHAMIKAYGRCRDVMSAFSVVDEAIQKGFSVTTETMNFLLQACISDKIAGFRHSLLVWKKMSAKKISPDLYSYNLLLKSTKDCGLGKAREAREVIEEIVGAPLLLKISDNQASPKQIGSTEDVDEPNEKTSMVHLEETNKEMMENIPNLIAKKPNFSNIISIHAVKKPEDRLILLGGIKGFVKNMDENDVVPDIKTYTQLLDIIPSTLSAEEVLLKDIKNKNVIMDIDFCNMLIKKRSMRCDYSSAKDVLQIISSLYLSPDIVTFGVLSLGCKTKAEAESLIKEMDTFGYRLNAEILGAMLHQACYHFSFAYIMFIMKLCKRMEIKPNQEFLRHLDKCIDIIKKWKKDRKDKFRKQTVPEFAKNEWFIEGSRMFLEYYKTWIADIEPEENLRPWDQFKKPKSDTEKDNNRKRKPFTKGNDSNIHEDQNVQSLNC